MILQYKDFNKWAHDYYLSRFKKNTKGTLCIDAGDVDDFLQPYTNGSPLHKIFHFREINSNRWSALLRNDPYNEIPLYFGLIALQCYAASKMEESKGIKADDFRTQLVQLVGIDSNTNLQNFFSEEIRPKLSVQEDIWTRSSRYLDKHGVTINLPANKNFKGRFTQFPLSQVILNVEDLKEYIPVFKNILTGETPVSRDYFFVEFRQQASRHVLKRLRNKSLDWNKINELAELQIFNFFCGTWENSAKAEDHENPSAKKNTQVEIDLLLIKSFSLFEFYHKKQLIPINSDLFKLLRGNNKFSENSILIFKEIVGYDNEFELALDGQLGETLIFVVHRGYHHSIEQYLRLNYTATASNNQVLIYEVTFEDSLNVPEELRRFAKQPYPIELNGFKISRQREYFEGFGPHIHSIDSQTEFSVFHEAIKEDNYHSVNAKIGEYKVRIPGFTDLKFRVIPKTILSSRIEPRNVGWNILRMIPYAEENHLQGGRLVTPATMDRTPLMRTWLAKCRGQKVKSDNQLIKILNQGKNGY